MSKLESLALVSITVSGVGRGVHQYSVRVCVYARTHVHVSTKSTVLQQTLNSE